MKVREIIKCGDSEWLPNTRYDEVQPLISVLLPTYSRGESGLLARCLDSVLNQSFRQLELIIVIDASTDGTIEICKEYMERDSRVNIILHRNNIALPAVSTYEAYLKARGNYLAYAFDDNVWNLDALARTYSFMEENHVKASFGITRVRDPKTKQLVEYGRDLASINDTIWARNMIGAGSVVLHRDVLETVGLHDPHLALTRVCDWDLWIRICEWFPFIGTNIPFSEEFGVSLSDSLGNAFKLDQWFLRERQQHRNLKELLPAHYPDIDITEHRETNSHHYQNCLEMFLSQYQEKAWFQNKELEHIKKMIPNQNHRYCLFICSAKTGSYMNFDRYNGDNLTFCFCTFDGASHSMIIYADVAIVGRVLTNSPLLQICKQLLIPCYYFVDDNFCEIAKEGTHDLGVRAVAKKTTPHTLSDFSGVIVTTPALQDYFLEKKLHSNVILLSAVYKQFTKAIINSGFFTFAFMGGDFREDTLKKYVIPALYEFSNQHPVRLICPCTKQTERSFRNLEKDRLEIIPFHRTLNYAFLLNSYNQIGVDVLIHCGENNSNSIYKTKNALINAASLNVPLIVSDMEPYGNTTDGSAGAYIIVQNTKEAWLDAFQILFDNKLLRNSLIDKEHIFCKHYYDSTVVWEELSKEFVSINQCSSFELVKRYENLCDWQIINANEQFGLDLGFRRYNPDNLAFSGELVGIRRYGFRATQDIISEVGLLFAASGECTGEVILTIWRKGETSPISTAKVPFTMLEYDSYTNIPLDVPITTKRGELLYIDIEFHYLEKNGYIGIFEDRSHRTILYRLFNKLGHPIPGKDAIFIDCRS